MGLAFLHSVSGDTVFDQSELLMDSGRADEAVELLQIMVSNAPGDARTLLYLGLALVESGSAAAGIKHIERATKLSPDNHLLHFFMARALYDNADYKAALKHLDLVHASQPDHPGTATLRHLCKAQDDMLAGFSGMVFEGMPDDSHLLGRALLLAEQVLLDSDRPEKTYPQRDLAQAPVSALQSG